MSVVTVVVVVVRLFLSSLIQLGHAKAAANDVTTHAIGVICFLLRQSRPPRYRLQPPVKHTRVLYA